MADFDLSNFIASFFDEARERLNSINQHLVNFEAGTLESNDLIALRRDAHTIKGSALMLGVNDVGAIAHIFEDMMEELIEHPDWQVPQSIQFLYDLHDMLDVRLQDPDGNTLLSEDEKQAEYTAMIAQFKQGDFSATTSGQPKPNAEVQGQDSQVIVESAPALEDYNLSFLVDEEQDVFTPETFASNNASLLSGGAIDNRHEVEVVAVEEPLTQAPAATAVGQKAEAPVHGAEPKLATTAMGNDEAAGSTEFRPKFHSEKERSAGQRKNSGRFLRVDAERLEELSHHIIEMSTEQSRVLKSKTDLEKTELDLRELRREIKKMSHVVAAVPAAKASVQQVEHMLDVHVRQARRMNEEARYQAERSTLVLRELRDEVLSLMLRPLDSIFSTFPRAVRDVAARIGKRVRLVVDGKAVEMDQSVAESLVEPLVHLLNNAVAHGIEDNAERVRLGKPEEGQVTIIAHQSGNEVRIEVMDDGRGIDTKIIKRVAVERGVTTQDEADLMDSAEVLEMIFRPGFSTMAEVGSLAGRGIGMNVVQDTVRRLTGSIRIHTELGKGTRFVVSVPVSVAVQQALMFTIGDQQYGMLTHMIEQAVPYNIQKIEKGVGGKNFLAYESYQVPIVDLRMMMLKKGSVLSESPYIIVSEHIEGFVGIVVDSLLGDGEIVVRNLDPYIKRYQPQGLMGNTIIDDGTVVMLLEPYGIKEMGRTSPDHDIEIEIEEEDKFNFSILLVDDSLIAREIERSIFESLGFMVDTAIDGMDGLDKLAVGEYDMVITDLEMPRLDGFGFVRQIRNQPEYEDMPVMVISTRESAEDRMRALEAGADSYMVKQHLDGDSILSTVQALVGPLVAKEHGVEHQQPLRG